MIQHSAMNDYEKISIIPVISSVTQQDGRKRLDLNYYTISIDNDID